MKTPRHFWPALALLATLFGCGPAKDIPPSAIPSASFEELKIPGMEKRRKEVEKELRALHNLPEKPYIIASGDKFDFKVYDNADLAATGLQVTPDGNIAVGLLGVVKVGGLTLVEATRLIEKKLERYIKNPKVILIPTSISSSTFTIVGKVGVPDVYPIRNNFRLTDAVAVAQGFTVGEFKGDTVEMADLSHAFIVRDNKVLPVDFEEAIRKGNALHNIPLVNGDYIYIPSSNNKEVYVLGEVDDPTNVGFKEGMTLMQAVTYAGGKKETAAFDALVVRGNIHHPKVFRVYMEDILRGEIPDFRLKPNDIVYLPKGTFSDYNVIIEKMMPTAELVNLIVSPIFGGASIAVQSPGN